MTAGELRAALAARAAEVCAYLLPAGRVSGDEFEVGSLAGEAGRSLKINLDGRVGVWSDFATGQSGSNLLALWHRVRGHAEFGETMREAAEWLGLPAPAVERPGGIPEGHPKWHGPPAGRWIYCDGNGAPWLVVYRYEKRTGGKVFFAFDVKAARWIEKGGHRLPERRPLYRLPNIAHRPAGKIVLAEGEPCADALARFGIEATTTMGGAGQVRMADFSPLRGWRVLIWPDNDEAGRKYGATAAEMLRAVGAEPLLVPVPAGKPRGWDVADAAVEGWTPEEIRAQLEMATPWEGPFTGPDATFRLLSDVELEQQPPLAWCVENFIPAGAFAVLYGPPGALKTSLALDIASCIASGRAFHTRAVHRAPALYVIAESGGAFSARLRAWKRHRAVVESIPLYFLPHPVQLTSPRDIDALIRAVGAMPSKPGLIVIDTLSRCLVGADENAAKDLGVAVAAVDRIRAATSGAVLLVHHSGKTGQHERGSSVLRGACDVMLAVECKRGLLSVRCEKMRDAPAFPPLTFTVEVQDLGDGHSACVLTPAATSMEIADSQHQQGVVLASHRQALDVLKGFGKAGATYGEWHHASGLPEATFRRARKELERSQVARSDGVGRGARYYVVERSPS